MWAMVVKEFRQLGRDHRTLGLLVFMPVVLLVVFGYAASFDVDTVEALAVGPGAGQVAGGLPALVEVVDVRPEATAEDAEDLLRDGEAAMAVVADGAPRVLVDGSRLFTARAVVAGLSVAQPGIEVEVLFNPALDTPTVMVPALIGLILLFVGTVATSLGVVRERQTGMLEQLAVMPFRPRQVFVGKIAPYFVVATVDLVAIVVAGVWLFDVPFRGSVLVFALGSALFLFVTLGTGVLISTVSANQGQAIQLAIMTLLPQVLLSGMIFPLESMPAGIRLISAILPLTYFVDMARAVMIRGAPLAAVWQPIALLALLGVVVFGLALLRFARDLAPARSRARVPVPAADDQDLAASGAS